MKNEVKELKIEVNGKTFTGTVEYQSVESAEDILNLCQDEKKLATLIANINYATDLKARAVVRQRLMTTAAGPDKQVAKMIAELIKTYAAFGKKITEEEAKTKVTEQLKSLGLDLPSEANSDIPM